MRAAPSGHNYVFAMALLDVQDSRGVLALEARAGTAGHAP
jgi:hypothetical protein